VIVGYACGDGLGHLTRLRAALHTLAVPGPVTVITTSTGAADPRVRGQWRVVTAPRPVTPSWLAGALTELAPTELVVDAFPAGLDGELSAGVVPAGTPVTHLARRLNWDRYGALLSPEPLLLDRTWLVEEVDSRQRAFLDAVSTEVAPLEPVDPPAPPPAPGLIEPGSWLVVHSGPASELLDLVDYALQTALLEGSSAPVVLISPHRPDQLPQQVRQLDIYPATPLFPLAGRVVTAAGWNAVRQLAPWRDKHRMVPFPRRYDDQFHRAALIRVESRGTAPS
jgi:hypothetical protein